MQINNNIRAMVTQHALFQNNNSMSKSLEKLSTGLRINRAQDDAAGLAMSEQMRTQIRGLGKAKQNSQDGIAALQIAEGGLSEITNIMQRQRELAVQAANDTLTSTERKYLDDEFQELTNEIARIARTTDYNGKNMLNWTADPNTSFGAVGDTATLLNALNDEMTALKKLEAGINTNTYTSDFKTSVNGGESLKEAVAKTLVSYQNAIDALSKVTTEAEITKALATLAVAAATLQTAVNEAKAQGAYFADIDKAQSIVDRLNIVAVDNRAIDALGKAYGEMVLAGEFGKQAASYTLHVGPNYSTGVGGKWGNEMTITYLNLNPAALGLTTKNITSQNRATEAIDQLDKVIKSVSGARAKIGTFINRLEYTVNNIANLEFNTQDAESRIRDTNFAFETTNFTRNQIMVQSATSMLAQANALPQSVLGLLG